MRGLRWIAPLLLVLLFGGCLPAPGSTPTPPPAHLPTSQPTTSPLPSVSPLPTLSPIAKPCEAVMLTEVPAYVTPDGELFGSTPVGYQVLVEARAEGGWIGFDPGVAHAAAVGPFRLVWVRADAVRLEGDCDNIPLITPPSPDYCYEMAMWDIPLRAEPQTESDIVAILSANDYAVILGLSPDEHWYKLHLHDGTEGWMAEDALNITGACDDLPTLQP